MLLKFYQLLFCFALRGIKRQSGKSLIPLMPVVPEKTPELKSMPMPEQPEQKQAGPVFISIVTNKKSVDGCWLC